jgi:hypothetical protein
MERREAIVMILNSISITQLECITKTKAVVGFEVFTVVVIKSIIFWDMTLHNGLHGVTSQKMILFTKAVVGFFLVKAMKHFAYLQRVCQPQFQLRMHKTCFFVVVVVVVDI